MALTKLEKDIKRINQRIVNAFKTYGQSDVYQTYIEPTYGQNFVKIVDRKIGETSSGQPVYAKVPQLITSNSKVDPGFVKKMVSKSTPAQQIKSIQQESSEMYDEKITRAEAEQLLKEYNMAQSNISSILLEYYNKAEAQDIEANDAIHTLRKSTNTRLEVLEAYNQLKEELELL